MESLNQSGQQTNGYIAEGGSRKEKKLLRSVGDPPSVALTYSHPRSQGMVVRFLDRHSHFSPGVDGGSS